LLLIYRLLSARENEKFVDYLFSEADYANIFKSLTSLSRLALIVLVFLQFEHKMFAL
jgi:hypothetical protein